MKQESDNGLSRRDFLVKGGIVFGGSIIIFQTGCAPIHRTVAKFASEFDLASGIKEDNPTFWFEVLEDNLIKMVMPKCEMGQGIFTGFAMIAAEELEVEYEQMLVAPSSTEDPLDQLGTGGSTSTRSMYEPLREVAAKMREMLLLAAADIWQVNRKELSVAKGVVAHEGKNLSYREIVNKTEKWKIPHKIELKNVVDFKVIGKEVKRTDILSKVKGEAVFGIDKELEGMLFGMFVKSPVIGGKPKNVDSSETLKIKDVVQVIDQDDILAVIATNRYAAEMGARLLKVSWETSEKWTQSSFENWVTVGNGKKAEVMKKGNPKKVLKKNESSVINVDYRTPLGAHAQMEPNGSIAHYEDGKIRIIAGVQAMPIFQKQVAKLLKIKESDVIIENTFLGGGFGRKSFYQDIAKVALVSKIIGKAVHIFGDRTQEFQNGYLRPATHHTFEVHQADNGKITAIDYQLATDNMLLSFYPDIATKFVGSDPASAHGARIGYDIEHLNTTYWRTKHPFEVGSWRGVGMFANTFAIESLMDELGRKAKMDPFEFRLMHLSGKDTTDIRMINLLNKLRDSVSWNGEKKANTGRGMACADDRRTVVGSVVDVSIENGQIRVLKITTAIDAGKVINPDGIRQQVEGCAIMGLGAALKEEVQIIDNTLGATNYHEYHVPTLSEIPEIEVMILESGEEPLGVGEPPIAPISAAIANAIFDLTGERLRKLPLKLSKIEPSQAFNS